jgi:hypothetical protein
MHTLYNPAREREQVEQLCPPSLKQEAKSFWTLSFQHVLQYVYETFDSRIFSSYSHAKNSLTHILYLKSTEGISHQNAHLYPVSVKDVTYEKQQMNTGIPVCFLFDSTLEFTILPQKFGAVLHFNRLLDEPIRVIHTRFGPLQGVFRFVRIYHANQISSTWNVPVFWCILNHEFKIPLLGRRGFYPCDFIEIGGIMHHNEPYRIHHPMIANLLFGIKLTIPTIVRIKGSTRRYNLIIDTLAMKSVLFDQPDLILTMQQDTASDDTTIVELLEDTIYDHTIHGVLGWDFISKNGMIMYQGHIIIGLPSNDHNTSKMRFINQHNMNPMERVRRSFSLFYDGNNGISFLDFFVRNVNEAAHINEVFTVESWDHNSVFCSTVTIASNTHLVQVSDRCRSGSVNCLVYISRSIDTKCYAYLNESQMRTLQLTKHISNGSSLDISIFMGVQAITVTNLPIHHYFSTCFPIIILNERYLFRYIHIVLLQSISESFVTLKIISNFRLRSVVKLVCKLPGNSKDIPWSLEETEIIIPSIWSFLLNLEDNGTAYVMFPSSLRFITNPVRMFTPVKVLLSQENTMICTLGRISLLA